MNKLSKLEHSGNSKRRLKRSVGIRKKISGDASRPRLSVFRTSRHIYVQAIDDVNGVTVASASSNQKGFSHDGGKSSVAAEVGKNVAQKLSDKGIEKVVFDRNGYRYHGRVASLAEGAREAGLIF